MKKIFCLTTAASVALLVGCSTTPIVLAPVGPNPTGEEMAVTTGRLQVFSSLVEENDDQNQGGDGSASWYQHTDYKIYTPQGKLVRRVSNETGYYEEAPRTVVLPAGDYLVTAESKHYLPVKVPVVIERGRTTRVHLDGNWKLPKTAGKRDLVTMPNGSPVGWRDQSAKVSGNS